jgi:hypothetical protein
VSPFSDEDLQRAERTKRMKPRPKGSLPYLPDTVDPEVLRDWLTAAFRPPEGWRVQSFDRAGRERSDPCWLTLQNGRDSRVYRFGQQNEVLRTLRAAAVGISDGQLRVPHLTGGETEDVWAALCTLGNVLTTFDERDETRRWIRSLLDAARVLRGYTLVPDARHDALMAIKNEGEFSRADALQLVRPVHDHFPKRPLLFIDEQTGEQWVRSGETATFVRWVLGVEPLRHATLQARLIEVGATARRFEDYRPPHPKLTFYGIPEELRPVEDKRSAPPLEEPTPENSRVGEQQTLGGET